jgi:cell division protein FtsI/penicillin-binding protein 2
MSYTYGTAPRTAPRFENQRGDPARNSLNNARAPIMDWRYSLVGAIFVVLPALIALQVIGIQFRTTQINDIHDKITALYQWEPRTVIPARGQIFDRWGSLLTGNKTVYEIGLELAQVENPRTIAETLNVVLGMDYAYVLGLASIPASESAVYAVVADNISPDQVEKLRIIQEQVSASYSGESKKKGDVPSLSGLIFSQHLARTYPENTLAANIIGFVGGETKGYFGVEEKFNELLSGKSKTIQVPRDPIQAALAEQRAEVPAGASLILTIDRQIQRSMEDLLDESLDDTGAKSGTIIVENPKTGEILAMATTPRMNPNEFWRYSEVYKPDDSGQQTPFDRAVSQAYEPGSVFKVLTMAAALDAGAVKPDTVFVDPGSIEVHGLTIYNWDMGAWGPQDMTGCLQHSLNVCLAWVALQLGPEKFYSYMQSFGLGRFTGIDLAGEVAGRLKIPGDTDWYPGDIGTNAFGQGVSTTPIQMITAVSALANEGRMMTPVIVRSVVNDSGTGRHQYDLGQKLRSIPIKAETARTITEMLARSLEIEASDALVTGYRVAGKTGTAEIPTPFGYTTNETNASFVGWGPVDDPQFIVYIWLERPKSSAWGSIVAAPVFSEAVKRLVLLLNLPPDDIRIQMFKAAEADKR